MTHPRKFAMSLSEFEAFVSERIMTIALETTTVGGHDVSFAYEIETDRVLAVQLGKPTSKPMIEKMFASMAERITL